MVGKEIVDVPYLEGDELVGECFVHCRRVGISVRRRGCNDNW